MSLHPPHLIDSSASLIPAALIPFCAYQTNMTLLGQTRQDLPFTVCDKFQPTYLEGQLCYSLDLSRMSNKKTKSGLKSGVVLIIDPFVKELTQQTETRDIITSLNFESLQHSGSSAKIHLNTLASFTDYRAGSYAMFALKKITGTATFMELPDRVKKCKTETFEECYQIRYIAEVQKQCGCLPWGLNSTIAQQVKNIFGITFFSFIFRASMFAHPCPTTAMRKSPPPTPTTVVSPALGSMQMLSSLKIKFSVTVYTKKWLKYLQKVIMYCRKIYPNYLNRVNLFRWTNCPL